MGGTLRKFVLTHLRGACTKDNELVRRMGHLSMRGALRLGMIVNECIGLFGISGP
jgi:hypothetical protein